VTYFERAQADQAHKEKWIELAVRYSERALEANPNDLVNVFNLGDSYMAAGMNLDKPLGCSYYEKSLQTFDHLRANRISRANGERLRENGCSWSGSENGCWCTTALFCEEWGAAIASPTLPHVRGEN